MDDDIGSAVYQCACCLCAILLFVFIFIFYILGFNIGWAFFIAPIITIAIVVPLCLLINRGVKGPRKNMDNFFICFKCKLYKKIKSEIVHRCPNCNKIMRTRYIDPYSPNKKLDGMQEIADS